MILTIVQEKEQDVFMDIGLIHAKEFILRIYQDPEIKRIVPKILKECFNIKNIFIFFSSFCSLYIFSILQLAKDAMYE